MPLASIALARFGPRRTFAVGALVGVVASAGSIVAIVVASFWLFLLCSAMFGLYYATSRYYPYAAADMYEQRHKASGISWVMIGGLVGVALGPPFAAASVGILAPVIFAGSYLLMTCISALGTVVALLLPPSKVTVKISAQNTSLRELSRDRQAVLGISLNVAASAIMVLMMAAAPLAIVACGNDASNIGWVIQLHLLCMFAPALISARLIDWFGSDLVAIAGCLFAVVALVIGGTGGSALAFSVALGAVGLGWNLMYLAATTMIASIQTDGVKVAARTASEVMGTAIVVAAGFSAGILHSELGWGAVLSAAAILVALAIVSIAGLSQFQAYPQGRSG